MQPTRRGISLLILDLEPIAPPLRTEIYEAFVKYYRREPAPFEEDMVFETIVGIAFKCIQEIGLVGGSIHTAFDRTNPGPIHFCHHFFSTIRSRIVPYMRNWIEMELGPLNDVFSPGQYYKMLVTYKHIYLVKV